MPTSLAAFRRSKPGHMPGHMPWLHEFRPCSVKTIAADEHARSTFTPGAPAFGHAARMKKERARIEQERARIEKQGICPGRRGQRAGRRGKGKGKGKGRAEKDYAEKRPSIEKEAATPTAQIVFQASSRASLQAQSKPRTGRLPSARAYARAYAHVTVSVPTPSWPGAYAPGICPGSAHRIQ